MNGAGAVALRVALRRRAWRCRWWAWPTSQPTRHAPPPTHLAPVKDTALAVPAALLVHTTAPPPRLQVDGYGSGHAPQGLVVTFVCAALYYACRTRATNADALSDDDDDNDIVF